MRKSKSGDALTVKAVAGTHVVLLGWNVKRASAKRGLLGFAIQREDKTENERYWLRGMKTFPSQSSPQGYGASFSSREQPFQGFQWADYSAKPDHEYAYTVVPMYGAPGSLREGEGVRVSIGTETEWGKRHAVFFNRGAAASQEYARRFQNRRPDQLTGAAQQAAYAWLSRGLVEALIAFIEQAEGKQFGLYGAIYEFQWPSVLEALRAAGNRGARVEIVYDAIRNAQRSPVAANDLAIAAAKIKSLCHPLTQGKIMHNKFLVLTKNGKPAAVWTGSTNITANGIFGHSNVGHAVRDTRVAAVYWSYWKELRKNPAIADLKDWDEQNTAVPPLPPAAGTTEVLSPRRGLAALKRYGEIAGSAKKALFMTFAFGMHEVFKSEYRRNDSVLRFALMEKEGNGSGLAKARVEIAALRRRPNVIVAIGHNIRTNSFDRWLGELSSAVARANVRWIHTKYMLVDPLGGSPMVVTGSANFSEASTTTNHENMLVIRGDRRVADIYLGEFMRSYSHHAFRESVRRNLAAGRNVDEWKPQFLAPEDSWLAPYFRPGSALELRRRYFSGG
ncbi:MAG TPA: phospholipase D-like domain-containing protein [Burkholderiales bacterium]|nr:phospholipase D-like domain-containing protein [Burkholderiales bacterium]